MSRSRYILMIVCVAALLAGLLGVIYRSSAPTAEARGRLPAPIRETAGPDTPPIVTRPNYTVTLGALRNLRPTESTLNGVSLLSPAYASAVNCSDPDQRSKGWAVGNSGVILSYCNGYWDHAIIVESIPTNLMGVQAISPTLSVAVGADGTVLMYMYDRVAANWVWAKSPIPIGNQLLYRVSMVPDGSNGFTGWAVGTSSVATGGRGALVKGTIDPPAPPIGIITPTHTYNWTNVTNDYPDLPVVNAYYAVQTLSPTNAWAVGGQVTGNVGYIIHWNGTTWSLFQQVAGQLYSLRMFSPTDGYAVGIGGVIYHYDGVTWSAMPSPTTKPLLALDQAPNGERWIVGYDGTLLKLTGGVWTAFTDLRTDLFDFRAVDFSSGHGWVVGTNEEKGIGGQILEYTDGLWLAVTPPTDNQLNAVSTISDNDAWAVGAADSAGGTIIHWDGKHWQRWYQRDLPIPAVDLYAIDMTDGEDGWAAGDPSVTNGPAVFLHWDGYRWAEPRYDAPVNVRVSALAMLDRSFGWAVATNGNAVAKYDGQTGYWSALATNGGAYYKMNDVTIHASADFPWGYDAWAVTDHSVSANAWFMRFMTTPFEGNKWDGYQTPMACQDNPPNPPPADGPTQTQLWGIQMRPGPWGWAVGDYKNRATIYAFNTGGVTMTNYFVTWFCQPTPSPTNPSRYYSVDIVPASGVAWLGGYYTEGSRKVAYVRFIDANGTGWGGVPFPLNGRNIYHRPIKDISMSSDTMGWAVGDPEDASKRSVIYQYPFPNFTLDTRPAARAVLPGQSTFFTATANSIGGFNANVNLSLLNWPTVVTGTIVPNVTNPDVVSTIFVTTSAGTPPGVYYLPLQGSAAFKSGDNVIPVSRVSYLKLTVTQHPVYSVSPAHGPAGTAVTIAGANFGADPGPGGRSTPTNHVTWAGVQLPDANVTGWSDTAITFTPPDNPALFSPQKFPLVGAVVVTAGGSQSNDDESFKIDNRLSTVSYSRGGAVITVTLTGTSLGSDPGSLWRSTAYEHVALNGSWVPNSDVKAWSNTVITFTVPSTSTGGLITVTSNGFESNALAFSVAGYKLYLPLVRQ